MSSAAQGRSDGAPVRLTHEKHQCHACHQQHDWSRLSGLGHLAPRAPCGQMPREPCQPRRPFHRPPAAAERTGRDQPRLWSRLAKGTLSLCVPVADVQATIQALVCARSRTTRRSCVCSRHCRSGCWAAAPRASWCGSTPRPAPSCSWPSPGCTPPAHSTSRGEWHRLVSLACRIVCVCSRVHISPPHDMNACIESLHPAAAGRCLAVCHPYLPAGLSPPASGRRPCIPSALISDAGQYLQLMIFGQIDRQAHEANRGLTTSACSPSPSMVRKMTIARPGCPPLWHTVISDVYSTTFPFSPAIDNASRTVALMDCQTD